MLFSKMDANGLCTSTCGKYFIKQTSKGKWMAAQVQSGATYKVLGTDVDMFEAQYLCDDEKDRQPCGCVLHSRDSWWDFCPKCGAKLPDFVRAPPPPPKKERKVKVPTRPEWLKVHTRGIEHGENWDCLYDGEKWGLVRIPGYTGWVSLGQSAYHPTTFNIMRKDARDYGKVDAKGYDGRLASHTAWKLAYPPSNFEVHEGRMNQAILDSLKRQVDELDEKRP